VDICPDPVTEDIAPVALGTLAAVVPIPAEVPAPLGPGRPVVHRTSPFGHIN